MLIEKTGLPRDALAGKVAVVTGAGRGTGSILEIPIETWDQVYAVNLRGAVVAIRTFLPGMVERKDGVISLTVGKTVSAKYHNRLISSRARSSASPSAGEFPAFGCSSRRWRGRS